MKLKDLLKRYGGLTIYINRDYSLYKGNIYIIDVYYNSKTIENRKIKKRKLINNLINDTINKLHLKNVKVNLIDKNEKSKGFSASMSNKKLTRHKIIIDLIGLKKQIREGYTNDYYTGRAERLSFVKNNKKLALYFVILHELAHIILRLNKNNFEYHADSFAIINLQKQGLINNAIASVKGRGAKLRG